MSTKRPAQNVLRMLGITLILIAKHDPSPVKWINCIIFIEKNTTQKPKKREKKNFCYEQ